MVLLISKIPDRATGWIAKVGDHLGAQQNRLDEFGRNSSKRVNLLGCGLGGSNAGKRVAHCYDGVDDMTGEFNHMSPHLM